MTIPHIYWYKEIDSTNTRLAADRESMPEGEVYAAFAQTAGRGQRGNTWESRPGENLTFSLLLKPADIALRDQFCISQLVALGLVDYLEEKGVGARIKWPNDIYVGDRKICGVLIENFAQGADVAASVVGVGLNLGQRAFPPEVPNATSLSLLTGHKYDPVEELPLLLGHILHQYSLATEGEGRHYKRTSAEGRYLSLLYRRGEWHFFEEMPATDIPSEKRSGQRFRARILGIDNSARLMLEDERGIVRSFYFKEIKYII